MPDLKNKDTSPSIHFKYKIDKVFYFPSGYKAQKIANIYF